MLVTFDVTATESCPGSVTLYALRGQNYSAIVESRVGSRLVPTADNFPLIDSVTVDGQLVASVPEDSVDPLEIDFGGGWPFDEIVTLEADLSGIASLRSEG